MISRNCVMRTYWPPSSDAVSASFTPSSMAPITAPVAAPVAQAPEPVREPARPAVREPVREPAREPVREKPPVVRHTPVKSAPAVCHSCGVVESINTVDQRAEGSGVGAAGGAILGGLLGNQVGGGHGRQLATVAGAVGGAVAGNQVETHMKTTRTWRIVVRMDNGTTRTFNQSAQPAWGTGDAVRVVNGQLRSADR